MRLTVLLPILLVACTADPDADPVEGCYELADGRCVAETFENPPVLQPDRDGVYRLTLAPTEVTIDGQRHCVRAYNGHAVGPTIDTPARQGDTPRSVRVDLVNGLTRHDYQSLEDGVCACTNNAGQTCLPEHVHDRCLEVDEEDPCVCRDDEGEVCQHMFDFSVTNLHAHGSHVRPDYARGGEACEAELVDGTLLSCRECGPESCDDDLSDNTCFHGDDVLHTVHPGTGARYRWDIDEDGTHHVGLQWYHPHIHGTTAIQVASGAAGAWIVRGELDELPGIADARERVLVFSTPPIATDAGFQPLPDGEACTEETLTFNHFPVLGDIAASQLNVINGVRRPRLVTPPGQVERWRILHAGFLDEVFLGLFRGTDADCTGFSTADADTVQLQQIGRDGLILPQTFSDRYVFLSPGYRVEAMLGAAAFADGDTWCLVAARFLDGAPAGLGGFGSQPMAPQVPLSREDIFTRFDQDGDVVAILNVTTAAGAPTETELPSEASIAALAPSLTLDGVSADDRCAAAAATDTPDADQIVMLQVGVTTTDDPDPCDCEAYNVNCNNFESVDRDVYPYDRDLPLGAVEHWRVAASLDGHPFHIHINPFIACPGEDVFDPLPFPHWRDTYLVNFTRKADLITQNRAFTGPYVFHCHKLTHEDHGMMEVVRVCDPATDPTCGDFDWQTCEPDDLSCAKSVAATECAVYASNPADLTACLATIGGPTGVCGPNACGTTDDCDLGERCTDNVCEPFCDDNTDCPTTDTCSPAHVCVPSPCLPPCGPGGTCVHGTCG